MIDRREFLSISGAASGTFALLGFPRRSAAATVQPFTGSVISVAEFGARGDSGPAYDSTSAIQAAISVVERSGVGGTVVIPGRHYCGNILISGANIRLQGQGGLLVNGRLTVRPEASNIEVSDLAMLDTRGDNRTFFLDISGRDCRFTNVQLVKDPIAGGYQMYLRQQSRTCVFDGLKMRGSNGVMVAGRDHLFENFDLESKMIEGAGGDDAFALKGINASTENITIRDGTVRGFGAIVSFGSEIGTFKGVGPGAVRNVLVENVTGDRCTRLAFFKPGAFDYDYRDGLVERIALRDMTLSDPAGAHFRSGVDIQAGRGATIRNVRATGIRIVARAMDRGVAPTGAIEIALLDKGSPATIEDLALQVVFTDPDDGAPHSAAAPGFPVDHIVHIEKRNRQRGKVAGILIDIVGRGCSFGGVSVGPGLDGAVTLANARLTKVVTDPPAAAGAAAIWSESRLQLGTLSLSPVKGSKFGGRAFPNRGN